MPQQVSGASVEDVVDAFLSEQEERVETGEIEPITFESLQKCAGLILKKIPKTLPVESVSQQHVKDLRTYIVGRSTPTVAKVDMSKIKMIFKFGIDENVFTAEQLKLDRNFKPPSKTMIRKHRNAQPKKLFKPNEVRDLLKHATAPLKLMIYLGLNCGMNNADICNLKRSHIESGWLDYPRHKTGVERRVPLWKETIKAYESYLKQRPVATTREDKQLVFVTMTGRQQWTRYAIANEFRKTKTKASVGDGSYTWLRHTFQTIGDNETRDFVAVRAIMGHVDDSISGMYREEISEKRLKAVVNAVRKWMKG